MDWIRAAEEGVRLAGFIAFLVLVPTLAVGYTVRELWRQFRRKRP